MWPSTRAAGFIGAFCRAKIQTAQSARLDPAATSMVSARPSRSESRRFRTGVSWLLARLHAPSNSPKGDPTMKKARVLMPIISALVLANVTAARAGAYGETGTAEETPHAAPPASLVADEEEEGWTFVITPQLWAPHIDSGGFAGNSNLQTVSNVLAANGISDGRFKGANSEAVDDLDLQWGFQLGAKKGRWAIGLSYQSSDFETRTDMVYHGTGFSDPNVGSLSPGEVAAQEFVNTSRTDVDFAMSYTFPDVVPNRLDLAAGLGLKMIYADSVRYYSNLNQFVATVNA